ncbi:ATP-dependent helicase HrpB [Lichenibacterium dinghuense]|uniref:ATP-dependent helicase HrpB n=1 Tax=Lichenibacterium dinghuense TaxID=2895977 RepID=UPI001F0033EC|nr:ATP-dependent helicase HrpB [Lichenibacterium sp. 6Y81]
MTRLPIDDALPELLATLRGRPSAVLVAPPGAGKTTRVPIALLDEPWTAGGRILLLEPRRLAARAAAERMSATLGDAIGGTVGVRARFDTAVSARTRIEVVTEGVFTRAVLDDPELGGVAAVIFDEYHERSLDADAGLALALDVQGALRPDLRVLVMSATLDGARVAGLLGDPASGGAPVVESRGRAFPVETRYMPRGPDERIEEAVAEAVVRALLSEPGSVLAFLPGQGEIARTAAILAGRLRPGEAEVAPLYGALDRAAQDRAVRPSPAGARKVVLATSIAESSLTIEGIRVVVDSGLARVPRFEPDLGLTRLETVRVSRASADQRRGRAGRTEPGTCYRLWAEAADGALPPFARPEMLDADLSGLVLDLATFGVAEPATLRWLDPPPAPAVAEARKLLAGIGALDGGGVTAEGRGIARIAAPPRIARMVVEAARRGAAGLGGEVAAMLVERGLGGAGADLAERLERWRRDRSSKAENARGLARTFSKAGRAAAGEARDEGALSPGIVLALAFPDRIAKARGRLGEFLLANGRAAAVEPQDPLARAPFLAVGEITGRASSTRILLAAALDAGEVESAAGAAVTTADELSFDPARAALSARRATRLGAILLGESNLPVPGDEAAALVLAEGIARLGVERLPWSKALGQWRDRVAFLRAAALQTGDGEPWPDLSDAALREAAADWLAPFLLGKASLREVGADDLGQALDALLDRALHRRLDAEAPTHFEAPTGSRLPVDYAAEGGPAIAVRVQELFGLSRHPALAGGRVPLVLELLSPAHRPIQITRDLPGFWRGSWAAVRSEMRGRYPRHPWPEDPAAAAPTMRAKPRGT